MKQTPAIVNSILHHKGAVPGGYPPYFSNESEIPRYPPLTPGTGGHRSSKALPSRLDHPPLMRLADASERGEGRLAVLAFSENFMRLESVRGSLTEVRDFPTSSAGAECLELQELKRRKQFSAARRPRQVRRLTSKRSDVSHKFQVWKRACAQPAQESMTMNHDHPGPLTASSLDLVSALSSPAQIFWPACFGVVMRNNVRVPGGVHRAETTRRTGLVNTTQCSQYAE